VKGDPVYVVESPSGDKYLMPYAEFDGKYVVWMRLGTDWFILEVCASKELATEAANRWRSDNPRRKIQISPYVMVRENYEKSAQRATSKDRDI